MQQATMPPLACPKFGASAARIGAQRELIFDASAAVTFRLTRMKFMARLTQELVDALPDKADLSGLGDASKIYMCAQIIREAVEMAEGEMARIETACGVIYRALSEGGHA